jgi:serine/threonine protein kinase/tetratricopeptide (TPR) repeat protein
MAVRFVAQYEILQKLGSGGMGEVYRARDQRLGRDVAIKFLPSAFAADAARLARFEQEARAASALNHPNVVTIHEVGRGEDGAPYLVMELVKGRSLRDLMSGGKPLLQKRHLEMAAQAVEGLAKAHAAGIVHRDLKPENIMVTDDGFVKILDFGLAKLTHPASSTAGSAPDLAQADTLADLRAVGPATMAGAVLGTVGYMSPEQAQGRPVDFRSDQFSCGAIFYEMATGRRAFQRADSVRTMAAIIEDEPEAIAGVNPACPMAFRWIVERCLKKEPGDRYASTLDLAKELRTLCERFSETTSSSSGSQLKLPALGTRTRWWALAVAVAGVAIALAAGPIRNRVRRTPIPGEKHVAVLPFEGSAADADGRALSDGLVDTVASQLTRLESRTGSLWVVPMSEVRAAGVGSVSAARRAFGVTLVVTGNLRKTGDRLRLNASLVDAVSLRQIRSMAPIETAARDLASFQDEVAVGIARMLDLELGAKTRDVLSVGGTRNPSAYDLYLKGRGYLARYENPENLDMAISSFQAAIQRDASFALAYAGLGEAYWRQYDLASRAESADLAQKFCRRALAINDLLAPVHVTLGLVDLGTGRASEALADFKRARALDPRNADARLGLANALTALGRVDEAEATYREAIEERPDYWGGYNDLGRFYYTQSRFKDAEEEFRRVIDLTPDSDRGYSNLGGLYHLMGRDDEALSMLRRSLSIRPTAPAASNIGTIEFYRGRYQEAARAFEDAIQKSGSDYQLWYNLAAAYYWAPGLRPKCKEAYEKTAFFGERARATNPRDAWLLAVLSDSYAHLGQPRLALQLANEALRLSPGDAEVLFRTSCVLEFMGERERALALVEKAVAAGFSADEIGRTPDLEALRKDPRYTKSGRS